MRWKTILAVSSLAAAMPALSAQTVFSASGSNGAAIQATVDAFRTELGPLNPNTPGSAGSGRREINWDGVSDASAAPGLLPADFFNVVSPRGVVFALGAGGTGFQVSADATNPSATPVEFGNLDATHPTSFAPFSVERLFTALGTVVTDVHLRIPGEATPAASRGFGAVFCDVDSADSTTLEFFQGKASLGSFDVPAFGGDGGLSFLGVAFDDAVVTRVRITAGDGTPDAADVSQGGTDDVVVMDDFVYGEPVDVVATFTSLEAQLQQLLADTEEAVTDNKLEKLLKKDLNHAIQKVQKAIEKDELGKTKVAKKLLKSGAVHLQLYEKRLDTKQAVADLDAATRVELSMCAAMLGVDFATLQYE